jgi:hypothetical protein
VFGIATAAVLVGMAPSGSLWMRGWPGYAYNAQHSAKSPSASQPLLNIHWQTPVDLAPPGGGIHYGSPLITARNNVIVTVKTQSGGSFRLDCRKGSDGTLLYSQNTDYVQPQWGWVPSCGSTLTPQYALASPAAGGTVLLRASADSQSSPVVRQAFFGMANYNAAPATYNANVKICTPITSDSRGDLFFGFLVSGPTPANLVSGIARINPHGAGVWTSAATAAGDPSMTQIPLNCAPAISNDGLVVYIGVSDGGSGYLVGLSASTLAPLYKVRLKDPTSNNNAWVTDYSTASPTVGPDGDVFYGVLESPFPNNNDRGWLEHYNSTLTVTLTPGAFGWDDTASTFPSSAVPQYNGTSPYLLLTKYNNYANIGSGDGVNKVAVLDPHATQIDPITGATIMREILVKAGPTPDPGNIGPNTPNAVREWCINTAAVDVAGRCALVNNEDGKVYRWDFPTNTLNQVVTLTGGVGEAYTPTCVGPDGTVYAINNAILFAVGQ